MNTSIDIAIRRLGRMVGSFVSDWRSAQRLLLAYQLAPERFVFAPRGVPATYAEFLFLDVRAVSARSVGSRPRGRGAPAPV